MGVLRFFTSVISALDDAPTIAFQSRLDEIAAIAKGFSYIGNRKTLSMLVRQEGEALLQRLEAMPGRQLEALKDTAPTLVQTIRSIRAKAAHGELDIVCEWLGSQWEKDSGVFPDFLLALDAKTTFGNGALLELKDSKGDSIASFNSTLPTRLKSLNDVRRISGKSLVLNAAQLYDFPLSANTDYLSAQRHCFYLVRTQAKNEAAVKISLVEGSFFETLPKEQLLAQVWEQILGACGLAPSERAHIVELLSGLEQSEIARSRDIKRASIRPRLRLMAEVHRDARLHSYPEIKPRTVNLVIKREHEFDETWLHREFAKEDIHIQAVAEGNEKFLLLGDGTRTIRLRYFVINHKRNGEHIVLQYTLKSIL